MANRILFLCPDTKEATGGIKQLYRQVDILRNHGFDAYILHTKKDFRVKWFENQTPILYLSHFALDQKIIETEHKLSYKKSKFKYRLKLKYYSFLKKINGSENVNDSDIIVFPEIYGLQINSILPNNKKVIFNQNCYYTFDNYPILENIEQSPYTHPKTIATIVASKDAYDYMSFAFPAIHLHRIRLGINSAIFNCPEKKLKQIAFMPRKLSEDVVQVINIIKQRGLLKDWKWVEIDKMNEFEVAQNLKDSAIFLSFNYREGFGLPPAEAMACGCVVVGYKGRAGEEYFMPSFSYPIEDRDVISFAKEIENLCQLYDQNAAAFLEKGKKGSDFILTEYSYPNEEQDIIAVWKKIEQL